MKDADTPYTFLERMHNIRCEDRPDLPPFDETMYKLAAELMRLRVPHEKTRRLFAENGTITEMCQELGVSRERLRLILNKADRLLRHAIFKDAFNKNTEAKHTFSIKAPRWQPSIEEWDEYEERCIAELQEKLLKHKQAIESGRLSSR